MSNILLIILLLQIKHFVLDFLYQPPYQWRNKGTLGHPGGLLHAGQHALVTGLLAVLFVQPLLALYLSLIEFILHYMIDWSKMNINKMMDWKADKNQEFWWLLGFDQFLHQLTYIFLAYMMT